MYLLLLKYPNIIRGRSENHPTSFVEYLKIIQEIGILVHHRLGGVQIGDQSGSNPMGGPQDRHGGGGFVAAIG